MSELTANDTDRRPISRFSRAALITSYAVVAVAGAVIATRGEPMALLICAAGLFAVFDFGYRKRDNFSVRTAAAEVAWVASSVVFALCWLWLAL